MRLMCHNGGAHSEAPYAAYAEKFVPDYGELAVIVRAWRTLRKTIAFTMGSWDTLHVGHARYLIRAAGYADILVAGTDTDEVVRSYKAKKEGNRPIIPEAKRIEMVAYLQCVDYVTPIVKEDLYLSGDTWNWNPERLLRQIQPEFFIAVEDSYPEDQIMRLQKWCREVIILPRQASDISTSEIVRKLGGGQ